MMFKENKTLSRFNARKIDEESLNQTATMMKILKDIEDIKAAMNIKTSTESLEISDACKKSNFDNTNWLCTQYMY